MPEKASLHKGKVSGQTGEKHMERDFDYDRSAEHIDGSRTMLNVCRSFCPVDGTELSFYKVRYQKSLDQQNERYRKKGNINRIRKMEDVYASKNTRPTEEILQYSRHGEVEIPKDEYDKIVESYVRKLQVWGLSHGGHFHVLKYSTHYDECDYGTTHTHIRTIWDYVDDNGVIHIGQEKGMAQSGLCIPDEEKLNEDIAKAEEHKILAESYVAEWNEKYNDAGILISRKPKSYFDKAVYDGEMKKFRSGVAAASRFNNRSITWTKLQRSIWEDTLEEFGYECDRNRAPKAKHLSKKEWDNKMNAIMQELVEEREKMQCELIEHAAKIDELEQTIEEQKELIEKNHMLIHQQTAQVEAMKTAEKVKEYGLSPLRDVMKFMYEDD